MSILLALGIIIAWPWDDRAKLRLCAMEAQRLSPGVFGTTQVCRRPFSTRIGSEDVAFPAGTKMMLNYRNYGKNAAVFGDVGPLFIAERLRIGDNASGMVVTSLALGPQPLDATLFPGVHYCKLLSPARVVDYVLTDALKNESTCLNT